MAQNKATVMVEGNVVKFERKNGDFVGGDGSAVSYDFIEARLLTEEYDTVDVRFPSDGTIPVPARDELVVLVCEARAARGDLKLVVKRVGVGPVIAA